uniref:Uncharacterized protein n=1 Tax=Rhizophora mucronata TaxID=61149 RepID=A0A2P2R4D9_RHIMU
MGHLDTVKGEL